MPGRTPKSVSRVNRALLANKAIKVAASPKILQGKMFSAKYALNGPIKQI